jgi:hypothetical protein
VAFLSVGRLQTEERERVKERERESEREREERGTDNGVRPH